MRECLPKSAAQITAGCPKLPLKGPWGCLWELSPENFRDRESQSHDAHPDTTDQADQNQFFILGDQFQQTIIHEWDSCKTRVVELTELL